MSVAAVILAAGSSSRLGFPKQLVVHQGATLLRRTVEAALSSVCTPVLVVLGAFADRIAPELDGLPVQKIVNEKWTQGMGSSVRAAISTVAVLPSLEAVIVSVCDQPFLSSAIFDALENRYRSSGFPIIASAYQDVLGVPALFDRVMFPELMQLEDASGAKAIIRRHPAGVESVLFPDGHIDIDTQQDQMHINADQPHDDWFRYNRAASHSESTAGKGRYGKQRSNG